MIDINETVPALNGIKPGEKVLYYEGNLAESCGDEASGAAPTPAEAAARYLRSTAVLAWAENRAHLVQRRQSDGLLQYVAIGKGKP